MRFLLTGCLVMMGVMSLTWIFILWANSKNLLKLEVQNEQLNDLASRDTLTGVYLFSAFKEKAQQLLDTRPESLLLSILISLTSSILMMCSAMITATFCCPNTENSC